MTASPKRTPARKTGAAKPRATAKPKAAAKSTAAKPRPAATPRAAAPAAGPPPSRAVMYALRSVLEAYAPALTVARDEVGVYELSTNKPYQGKPMFFGAVTVRKKHVSFHLMPVHVFPELLQGISPRLREHMDVKSCFNFTSVDLRLIRELAGLTAAGLDLFQQADLA